jgi:hypothetical protein
MDAGFVGLFSSIFIVCFVAWYTSVAGGTLRSLEKGQDRIETKISTNEANSQLLANEVREEFKAVRNDISISNERSAKMESQLQIVFDVVSQSGSPVVDREFLPFIASPSTPVGSGEEPQPVPGFEPMSFLIPSPRTIEERDKAISLLRERHLNLLKHSTTPVFDDSEYELAVSAQQVIDATGALKLQLNSFVVLK